MKKNKNPFSKKYFENDKPMFDKLKTDCPTVFNVESNEHRHIVVLFIRNQVILKMEYFKSIKAAIKFSSLLALVRSASECKESTNKIDAISVASWGLSNALKSDIKIIF